MLGLLGSAALMLPLERVVQARRFLRRRCRGVREPTQAAVPG